MSCALNKVLCALALACALPCFACDEGGDSGEDGEDETGAGPQVPACVEYTLEGCAPLYPATYDQVWNQTLSKGCAEFGTACHAQDDAAGALDGMTFVDPQQSWDHMLMADEPLVVPGDPLCSELFVRLASEDPAVRMPPGSSGLDDGALCSIATWIAEGATYQQP